jgi:uncharacterized membrane protein YbaN (DUF454 family)
MVTDVKIRTAAGSIVVTTPALFDCSSDAALHMLIERVFQASAVESVSVDRARATVEIRFDRQALDGRAALRMFSEALSATPSTDRYVTHSGSLLRPYLDRLPGPVRRVERRRDFDGRPVAASAGGTSRSRDLLRSNGSAGRIVTLLPAPASNESEVVVDVLVVEFDPSPAVSAPGSTNSSASPAETAGLRDVVMQEGRRLVNLAAAGGCFVMSIVGVITPGIPTVPFVLATGYFLARSSPALHERFRRSRFFGQMVRDYEEHGGLRWFTKLKMILLTAGLIVITVIVTGGSLPFLIVAVGMGGLGVYMLNRIPTIKATSEAATA